MPSVSKVTNCRESSQLFCCAETCLTADIRDVQIPPKHNRLFTFILTSKNFQPLSTARPNRIVIYHT